MPYCFNLSGYAHFYRPQSWSVNICALALHFMDGNTRKMATFSCFLWLVLSYNDSYSTVVTYAVVRRHLLGICSHIEGLIAHWIHSTHHRCARFCVLFLNSIYVMILFYLRRFCWPAHDSSNVWTRPAAHSHLVESEPVCEWRGSSLMSLSQWRASLYTPYILILYSNLTCVTLHVF